MATVVFKPIQDVSNLRFDKAIEVRHSEVMDVIMTLGLLEHALVDYSSFATKIKPTVELVKDNYLKHRQTVADLPSVDDKTVTGPVITMMTMDLEELRAVIVKAVKEDGNL